MTLGEKLGRAKTVKEVRKILRDFLTEKGISYDRLYKEWLEWQREKAKDMDKEWREFRKKELETLKKYREDARKAGLLDNPEAKAIIEAEIRKVEEAIGKIDKIVAE